GAVQKELYRHGNAPALVYVADLPTLPIGVMIKKTVKSILVIDCHEWWKEQIGLWSPHNRTLISTTDHYEKTLYPICDARITVGKKLADEMSDYFQIPFDSVYSSIEDTHCVEAGTDSSELWHKRHGMPQGVKIAIFQGAITTLRNLENLAKATAFLESDQR